MYKHIKTSIIVSSIVLTITGCATTADVKKDQEIQRLTKELNLANQKANQLDSANVKIKQLEKQAVINQELTAKINKAEKEDKNAISNSLIPPNAKTGECYARVLVPAVYEEQPVKRLKEEAKIAIDIIPATYKVKESTVTIREASTKLVAVPATYKTKTEQVMVEPEKTEIKIIPATYKTVTKEVLVAEEKTELVTIPATYKTVKEEVLISKAYSTWKHGNGAIEKIDDATGEIMCLIEVPAKYKTVYKKVVDVEAHTKKIVTPAVYKTITKKVIDTPASTKKVITPAVYKTVSTQVIDTPATTREEEIPCITKVVKTRVIDTPAREVQREIPAVYDEYMTVKKTSDSYLRWQKILCETNINPSLISKVQTTLKEKGYDISVIDGVYGRATSKAIRAYQKDNGLSQGALTLKTLESLGL